MFFSLYVTGFTGPAISSQVAQHSGLASAFYLNAIVAVVASLYALSQKNAVEKILVLG